MTAAVRVSHLVTGAAMLLCVATYASAAAPNDPAQIGEINPISMLESAGQALPGDAQSGLSAELNILLLLTVLSLAPALLILCTCFTRMVIVLGLLRQALGTQN